MSIEDKAELVMTIRDYEYEEKQKWDKGIDFTASDAKSDDKILLRIITAPESRSGVVGIDAVKEMSEIMKLKDYDKGVLISKRFTEAAKKEMKRENIQMISESFMPSLEPQRLYLKIQDLIDGLCKANCGKIPEKESDCKGHLNGQYPCKIRLISDNASFHFERGWTRFLQNDLLRLLRLHNLMNNKKNQSK
ncbi:MAG: restriction endonuclease [Candidatus Bathyarchaeota archaeon]|nr:restriction endonuclease [Candidatus Bathyarchaeota archaeon]MDH5494231.1 restriction endonuclease [Candidatus Bathyarchaeota archaeon]